MGTRRPCGSVELDAWDAGDEPIPQSLAQFEKSLGFVGHSIERQFQCDRHADDAGAVERAGTEVVLLASAERLRLDADRLFALMDDQTADPFGPVELVR